MLGKSFDGYYTRRSETDLDGKMVFSIGNLVRGEDANPETAFYFNIVDKEGTEVANFCLTANSFHSMMDMIEDTFDEMHKDQVSK